VGDSIGTAGHDRSRAVTFAGTKGASKMNSSKYLPPYTAAERVAIAGDDLSQRTVEPGSGATETEVRYADFLADEDDD
jgi:hypothetical protein